MKPCKIPISVLVVIHTPDGQVLVLQRADRPDYWQSVTGSLDAVDEDPLLAARRELQEETGFVPEDGDLWALDVQNRYEIYAHWRHRYAPGVTHNTEHVFAYALPEARRPRLSPREHLSFRWLPWREAASCCFSPNNAEMIRLLARRQGWAGASEAASAADAAPADPDAGSNATGSGAVATGSTVAGSTSTVAGSGSAVTGSTLIRTGSTGAAAGHDGGLAGDDRLWAEDDSAGDDTARRDTVRHDTVRRDTAARGDFHR